MRYFDLHCDTIAACADRGVSLYKNDLHVDICRGACFDKYVQCFAAWISDDVRGEAAFERFIKYSDALFDSISQNSDDICIYNDSSDQCEKIGAILTVENGAALGGKLENLQILKDRGVKAITLTWNGENELGRGIRAPGKTGITDFGRSVVGAMEEMDILVDVSHSSPELFYDVASMAKKPFIATHSNARDVCGHPRNLSKEQFLHIKDIGGLVGLNLYKAFLNDKPEEASMNDVLRHAYYFLSLGGEDVLAVGGDLDGSELPDDMSGLQSVETLCEVFLKNGFKESVVKKIFFDNCSDFFKRNRLL